MNMPTQAEPDASTTHLPVLDGLRGLAILLVTAGSVAVSMFTYRWIEQPPRRWMAARLRARQHARQDAVVPQIAMH